MKTILSTTLLLMLSGMLYGSTSLPQDPIKSRGQYWHPGIERTPKGLVVVYDVANGDDHNAVGVKDFKRGLQAHLFAQSVAGVVNKALAAGESEYGVWLDMSSQSKAYNRTLEDLEEMGVDTKYRTIKVNDVLTCPEIVPFIKGYILTDIERNPESAMYAAVAAHVYDAVIVDVRDEQFYRDCIRGGDFWMLCDATNKTTADSWRDFKDKCNPNGLVVMAVGTGELREFAIANGLFVINLNRLHGDSSKGQNSELFMDVLSWLEPTSPVYGWESNISEDVFVNKVSRYGHMMVPSDWAANVAITSLNYKKRQEPILADVIDPRDIDFDDDIKQYVSFYLSDGDNVQWMINNFEGDRFYNNPYSTDMKMSYGIAAANLSMVAPSQFNSLMKSQMPGCSLVETFGGGYYYVDNFGELANRERSIKDISKMVASHMRQHRIKVLALMSQDINSKQAKEAYSHYIKANDQLDGIIAVQYTPYAGGEGEIMWFTNSTGIDIPVVTLRYTLWNFGTENNPREGSPTYIADKIASEGDSSKFSVIGIHAWSSFADIGNSRDMTLESTSEDRGEVGAGAAKLCSDKLDSSTTKVVNVEELIWRIRMQYREEQTKKLLNID